MILSEQWWCCAHYTRSQRKRKKAKGQPKPTPVSTAECMADYMNASAHSKCGYRDPRGRIIPHTQMWVG